MTEAEARGKTTHEVFPKQQADAFTAHDRGVLAGGKAVEQEEVWKRADGDHTFLTVKFPILNYAGEVTGIGAIGTDITERKRAEEKLQRSEKNLQMRVAELEAAQRRLKDQAAVEKLRAIAETDPSSDLRRYASRRLAEMGTTHPTRVSPS